MANGDPTQAGNAGEHTWYGGGNMPPIQEFGPATGPGAGFNQGRAGGMPLMGQAQGLFSNNETLLAGIAHLSSFFAPLIVPLLIWLLTTNTMPYASRQGKQAFFFHLLFSAVTGVLALLLFASFLFLGVFSFAAASPDGSGSLPSAFLVYPLWFFVFFGVILALTLVGQGFAIYAAVQTFQGKPFSYPFLGRL